MNDVSIKFFGVVGFVILCALAVYQTVDKVQNNLQQMARASLQGAGLPAVQVSMDGRVAQVEGTVESAMLHDRAIAAVESLPGVLRVKDRIAVVPPPEVKVDTVALLQKELDSLLVGRIVRFRRGRAELESDSHALLEPIAAILKRHPGLAVEVAGHTDSRGNPRLNMALSQQRAEAVRRFLIDQGVAPQSVTAQGYGSTQPLDDNATAAGRERNRRVEFKLVKGR